VPDSSGDTAHLCDFNEMGVVTLLGLLETSARSERQRKNEAA
jgi:hypothetical protein